MPNLDPNTHNKSLILPIQHMILKVHTQLCVFTCVIATLLSLFFGATCDIVLRYPNDLNFEEFFVVCSSNMASQIPWYQVLASVRMRLESLNLLIHIKF